MPQLTPLMWVNSIVISLLVVMLSINMYCVSEDYSISCVDYVDNMIFIKLVW